MTVIGPLRQSERMSTNGRSSWRFCGCRRRSEGWSDGCYETRAGRCYGCWNKGWSGGCYETRAGCCCGCWNKGWSDSCCEAWAGCCSGRCCSGCCDGRYETRAGCCCGCWDEGWNDGRYERRAECCCRCWDKGRIEGWDSPSCPGDSNSPGRSQKAKVKRQKSKWRNHRKGNDLGPTKDDERRTINELCYVLGFWFA